MVACLDAVYIGRGDQGDAAHSPQMIERDREATFEEIDVPGLIGADVLELTRASKGAEQVLDDRGFVEGRGRGSHGVAAAVPCVFWGVAGLQSVRS